MPRNDSNSHRGPSHRRKRGHKMNANATRKLSKLKKLTIAHRLIQQERSKVMDQL